ncbi:MAG: alpha/beta fold hydrolase [Caldilineaceae bacterium]|jgi:pimeloyl-ACP methyl ester carboxylesterase
MNRRFIKNVARILGVIIVITVMLLVVGPFLIPVTPPEGLVSAQQAATDESQFISIPFDGTDGIDIHYIADGVESPVEAPTFVLLHGSLFNAFTWIEVTDLFGREGQVVAYDQIPYGLSEKLVAGDWTGPNPYTPEAAVDQLFSFLDELDLDTIVLVGHSYGGTLAVQAALAQPDRVEALILVDPAVYVQEEMPGWLLNLPQVRRLGPFFARQLGQNDAFLRQMYLNPDPIIDERMNLTRINTRIQNWDVALWEYLRAWRVNTLELATRISEIQQPALVITGDSDNVVPTTDSQRLDSELPDSELVILPSCGHVPQEECPDAFEEAVDTWLSQWRKR